MKSKSEHTDYQVICVPDAIELMHEVDEWLDKGYDLIGGVSIIANDAGGMLFSQAIAKKR